MFALFESGSLFYLEERGRIQSPGFDDVPVGFEQNQIRHLGQDLQSFQVQEVSSDVDEKHVLKI